ncbi:coiled-coil domain-containing protein 9B [Thalassophryne amazonica]|uniref:coiled-coil domain-containing protein 9B n=1 Tax=Thalassophryne amazonica TaxID=390379 RepID=UPI001471F74D|nr:coiled-coil domain-containing protein 9B [Thalassophryne amazonica]
MTSKKDHESDLELDKKIEALRRKNEALIKRYQEVEEDRKRAEEEGMAFQRRKGKADDLTITISKSTRDNRLVVTKPLGVGSSAGSGQHNVQPESGGEGPTAGVNQTPRRQLTVTMAGKKGKRVVSERTEKTPEDVRSCREDGQTRTVKSTETGKQLKDSAAQEKVKEEQERPSPPELSQEVEFHEATDLNIPTSKEEQEEYLQWKREREQIDRERVARHKNAKGQWRRAWDVDKTEAVFADKSLPDRTWGPSSRGGQNAKRGQTRSHVDSRGQHRGKDKRAKNVVVMSSKAKGKDRLTGRARRWHSSEEGDKLQMSETSLEEFLEELDAFTGAKVEDHKTQDSKTKAPTSTEAQRMSEEVIVHNSADRDMRGGSTSEDMTTQRETDSSSPQASEKKVRFSNELIQESRPRQTSGSQGSESRGHRLLKASLRSKFKHEVQGPRQPLESTTVQDSGLQDQGGPCSPIPLQQTSESIISSDTESRKKDIMSSTYAEKVAGQDGSVQPVEVAKCNISNTHADERMDSGLSVLTLASRETLPAHPTSSEKAREHGKIV